MINAVKQPSKFSPIVSDIIFGAEYIKDYLNKNLLDSHDLIPLTNFGYQGHLSWHILSYIFKLENINELKKSFTYEDPWSKNKYFYWYPEYIFCNNLNYYKNYINVDEYFWDSEFFKDMIITDKELNSYISIGSIARSFLGHGYNELTMPNDGGHSIREYIVQLDNDDYLVGHGWEWYNK